jgi:hypothetical protein
MRMAKVINKYLRTQFLLFMVRLGRRRRLASYFAIEATLLPS